MERTPLAVPSLFLLLPDPGRGDVKPAQLTGLREGKASAIYLQTGWPNIAYQAPCYFLRKTKNPCNQQHKVQRLALERCWLFSWTC